MKNPTHIKGLIFVIIGASLWGIGALRPTIFLQRHLSM